MKSTAAAAGPPDTGLNDGGPRGCTGRRQGNSRRRISQLTHSQAMVGKAKGWFEKAMGPDVKADWKTLNAGPSAIEAHATSGG